MKLDTEAIQELAEGENYFLPRAQFPPLQSVLRMAKESTAMHSRTLTFNAIEQIALAEEPNQQIQKTIRSVLRRFVAAQGLEMTDVIGRVFRSDFYPRRRRFLAARQEEGKALGTIRNESAILSRLRILTLSTDRTLAHEHGEKTEFQKALIELRDKVGGTLELSRTTNVDRKKLDNWIDGIAPGRGAERELTKVERAFGLHPRQLIDHMPPRADQKPWSRSGKRARSAVVVPTKFSARVSRGKRDPVGLKPSDISPDGRAEFQSLTRFKTDILGDGPSATGKIGRNWVTRSIEGRRLKDTDFHVVVDGRWCPTAGTLFASWSGFLGWLARPTEKGGAGFGPGIPHTLAWFVEYDLAKKYIDWLVRDRNDGRINGSVIRLVNHICSLIIPVHGFLWRHDELARKRGYDPATWKEQCEVAYAKFKCLRINLKRHERPTRDSFERIWRLVDMDDPMQAVWDAMDRMEADRPVPGGEAEAVWYRNYILLGLAACCPLRKRNFEELTWNPDGTGHLRKRLDGNYKIFVAGPDMKNRYGYARDNDYDYPVEHRLTRHLDTYLCKILPRLAKGETERVFVGTMTPSKIWENLSDEFLNITAKYFPETPGFRIHAMRHITATALVKETGGYLAAALALHDLEDTVRKHYGRFLVQDAARWMSKIWDRRNRTR